MDIEKSAAAARRNIAEIISELDAAIAGPDREAHLRKCLPLWGHAFVSRNFLDEKGREGLMALMTVLEYPTIEKSTYALKGLRYFGQRLLDHIDQVPTDMDAAIDHLSDSGICLAWVITGAKILPEYDEGFSMEDAQALMDKRDAEEAEEYKKFQAEQEAKWRAKGE